MQRQIIDFTKLCGRWNLQVFSPFLSFAVILKFCIGTCWYISFKLKAFSIYTMLLHPYLLHIWWRKHRKWLFVYSANYLYETKCDGFAGKVSERQFSYERWIGRNAQIFWFFLHKEDSWNSKFVQNVFKSSKIASFCRLFSSAFPIGNYWISWTTQDWLSVWLLKPESFCQRMPRTIPSNRIWNN